MNTLYKLRANHEITARIKNKSAKKREKLCNDCGNFSELHRTTEFMVLDQRQLPAQRLLLVSGLLEPRDLVGHWHYKSGIHHRFADQTLPSELCLAAPLFRQHRLGSHPRESVNRRIFASTWRGIGRVRFTRVPSDLERELNRGDVVCRLAKIIPEEF